MKIKKSSYVALYLITIACVFYTIMSWIFAKKLTQLDTYYIIISPILIVASVLIFEKVNIFRSAKTGCEIIVKLPIKILVAVMICVGVVLNGLHVFKVNFQIYNIQINVLPFNIYAICVFIAAHFKKANEKVVTDVQNTDMQEKQEVEDSNR